MRLFRLPARIAAGFLFALPVAAQIAPPSPAAPAQSPRLTETFGTADVVYASIDSEDMGPTSSSVLWDGGPGQTRYTTNHVGSSFSAALHLPAGAQLTALELDYYDASTDGRAAASLSICNRLGDLCTIVSAPGGCPGGTELLCSDQAGAPGFGASLVDLTANDIFSDPLDQRYVVFLGNTSFDGSTSIGQIIAAYRLRVSPAPATATFGDVPTSHPFFQFVEALASSGITAGCGGGDFCPDNPVTRGQMAVFLAKALGLHFQ